MEIESPLHKVCTTRKCPGKEGTLCSQFMADLSKDPHTMCAKCKGQPCSRNNTCNECSTWSEDQWVKFERIKRNKKDVKIAELESSFTQFSADFTSHRISTDDTLSSLKTDFQTIMAAIEGLKNQTATAEKEPARDLSGDTPSDLPHRPA